MKLTVKGRELNARQITFCAFIAVEAVIYVIFNALKFAVPDDPIYLKYSGILLCFAVTVAAAALSGWERDGVVLACAMAFTCVSDLFILVMDTYYEVGLVTFIITQSIYLYRLYSGRVNKIYITLAVRAALAAALVGLFAGLGKLNFLMAECCVYIIMLVVNCVESWLICKRGVKNVFFAIGMTLFLFCDICVGINSGNELLALGLDGTLIACVSFGIWFFYLPAQVLIALSAKRGGLSRRVPFTLAYCLDRESGEAVENRTDGDAEGGEALDE